MKSSALLLASLSLAHGYTITVAKKFMNKNIDPIVVPGQYKSHMHSFFGSDAVTINTTTSAELQTGCSSADNPNDYSSYWFPTLYKKNTDGSRVEVPVYRFSAYYVSIENAEIAIPQDFRNVVGNAKAKSQADVPALAGQEWFCEFGGSEPEPAGKDPAAFPSKGCPVRLQTLLLFHDCVNPDTLESAYSGTHNWVGSFKPANRCPDGMFRIPQLRFSIRFEMRDVLSEGWDGEAPLELACGSSYCFHGDFINGWLPEAAENMLLADDKREFAGVDGPDGAHGDGPVCGDGSATDADPTNGTSDLEESEAILSRLGARSNQETVAFEVSSPAESAPVETTRLAPPPKVNMPPAAPESSCTGTRRARCASRHALHQAQAPAIKQ